MSAGPRIYLAIDNCFASKRWTRPSEWAGLVRDLGLAYVEASADNECDPFYTTPEYLDDWVKDVRIACEKTGVRIANLYSGHGTYATLGLAHTDRRIRDRMLDGWLKGMARTASELGAGLGFFCHAFNESVLQDPAVYREAEEDLYDRLAEFARYADGCGAAPVGVEQMYSPHHIPWTLDGASKLLREVSARSGAPFYITCDTGHQYGQRRFLRPSPDALREALQRRGAGGETGGVWLGPQTAYAAFGEAAAGDEREACLRRVEEEMERHPYLFARHEDGDLYLWLERFGCYSPIVHLQQTDGTSSPHLPFTARNNRAGIVEAGKVLRAIAASYAREPEAGMPPRCEAIYMTIEIFSDTADVRADLLRGVEESVAYWRRHIPEDGLTLGDLIGTGEKRDA